MRNLVTIIFIVSFLCSCSSSKEFINYENVKKGEQLTMAKEISVNQLLNILMFNRSEYKVDLNCYELFRDEKYTYFGKSELKALSINHNLYKIQNDLLESQFGNYRNINGETIKNDFWDLYIPQSDKDVWNNSKCTSSSSNPKFSFELQNSNIFITLHWKVRCEGIKVLDKTYTGYFDMNKLVFDKTLSE